MSVKDPYKARKRSPVPERREVPGEAPKEGQRDVVPKTAKLKVNKTKKDTKES